MFNDIEVNNKLTLGRERWSLVMAIYFSVLVINILLSFQSFGSPKFNQREETIKIVNNILNSARVNCSNQRDDCSEILQIQSWLQNQRNKVNLLEPSNERCQGAKSGWVYPSDTQNIYVCGLPKVFLNDSSEELKHDLFGLAQVIIHEIAHVTVMRKFIGSWSTLKIECETEYFTAEVFYEASFNWASGGLIPISLNSSYWSRCTSLQQFKRAYVITIDHENYIKN